MSQLRGMNLGYFCGNLIGHFSVNVERDTQRVAILGYDGAHVAAGPTWAEVGMTLMVDAQASRDLKGLWGYMADHCALHTLGPGRVCPYCGDYNPAGLVRCHRCGGDTEWRPDASVERVPFVMRSLSCEYDRGGLCLVDLEMVSTEAIEQRHLNALLGFDLSTGARGDGVAWLHGKEGYYLCAYCGQAVREGDICPSCGGTRIPWSEVVKMDRACVYCGTKVVGGIVCPGCGRRLAGRTVSEVLGKRWTA